MSSSSNPNTSLFTGSFCRKPVQNFGGRRANEDRETLLTKARLEREKREKEKRAAQSILIIQSTVRSFLIRRALKRKCREEFDVQKKLTCDQEKLGHMMFLINYFYDSNLDVHRLQGLAKVVLMEKWSSLILENCNNLDIIWIRRLRQFLKNCLGTLSLTYNKPISTAFLRCIEVLTAEKSPFEFTGPAYFHIRIWLDLILGGNFFHVWRDILEKRSPMRTRSGVESATKAYYTILERPLSVITRLVDDTFTGIVLHEYKQLTGKNVASKILTAFMSAFCANAIPTSVSATDNSTTEPLSNIISSEVIPHLLVSFPYQQYLEHLLEYPRTNDMSDDFVSCTPEFERGILFSVLRFSDTENRFDSILFTKVVAKYISSIDKRRGPEEFARDYLYKFHISGVGMAEPVFDMDDYEELHSSDAVQYLNDISAIYQLLVKSVSSSKLNLLKFLTYKPDESWDIFSTVLSTLVVLEEKTAEKFPSFASIAFNKELLRNVFVEVFYRREFTNMNWDHLISFCWGFNHLLNSLHDEEFQRAIPMRSLDELKHFIRKLIEMYEEIVVKESVRYDAVINTGKLLILWSLRSLHDRNTRLQFIQEDCFVSNMVHIYLPVETHNIDFDDFTQNSTWLFRGPIIFLTDAHQLLPAESKLLQILNEAPYLLRFDNRISVWHRLLENDRMNRDLPVNPQDHIQIRRNYLYEDAFEKLSKENVPDMRVNVRISLVNVVGAPEAGVDGGGLLRDFLTEATKAGVDPNRGFFRLDSQNRIYPNPVAKSVESNFRMHFYLMGRLVGKALYEQILLELPLAAFFIQSCISRHVPSAVDYLATLDPPLHRNLLDLKNYSGDWNALGLDFTVTNDEFGQFRAIELKKNGADIAVVKSNVIEYIHLVAEYKINKETEEEVRAFRNGLLEVVPMLRMFSWREMQTLISGSEKPINVEDWKSCTNYSGGYTPEHPTILLFWEVVEDFEEEYLRKLLKFVTSCSRPPLLGFKDLVPNFGIQNAGVTDRLPTAATCMNLLKLPQYTDPVTLRQKLKYVVDAQVGFELS